VREHAPRSFFPARSLRALLLEKRFPDVVARRDSLSQRDSSTARNT